MTKAKGYMLAKAASFKSDFYRSHTGAVAIYHNKVLAVGWNSNKISTMQARYNAMRGFDGYIFPSTIHAEMMVLEKIKYLDIDFSQIRFYVWRGTDKPLISKPCAACEKALRDFGIKRVYYTGNNSYIEEYYN